MASVEKLNRNQVILMRELLKLNRETTRKEILDNTHLSPLALHLAIQPLKGFFINAQKDGRRELLNLTLAGVMIIKAFNLANNEN